MYSNGQEKERIQRYMVLKVFLCFFMGFVLFSGGEAGAQGDVVLPDLEMDGQVTQNLGAYTLPQDFSFEAEVRIDASSQWRHLVEVGGVEYGWHCPLRIEVGNEGQWYIAVGDGGSYVDADFQGSWRYGVWMKVLFTYVNGLGKFYENGQLIQEFVINKNVGAAPGSLIVGSFRGTDRFFQGGIKNGRIVAGELTPEAASGGGEIPPVDDGLPIVRLSEGQQRQAMGQIASGSHVRTPALVYNQVYYDCYATFNGQLMNDGHLYALHTRVAEWNHAVFQVQMRFFNPPNFQPIYTQINGVAIGVGDDVVVFKSNDGQLAIEANGQVFSGAIGQLETARFVLNVQQAGNSIKSVINLKDDQATRLELFYQVSNGAAYFNTYLYLENTAFEGKNLGLFGMLPDNQDIRQLWNQIRTVTGDPGFFAVPAEKRLIQ